MFNEVLYLIKETEHKDEIGQIVKDKSERMVFALVKPIAQKEFFEARKANPPPYTGIRASRCFEIQLSEYDDEEIVKYNGKTYTVYRNYPKFSTIELYCEVRSGANGQH